MPEINKDLIKKALGLCNKTMDDMEEYSFEIGHCDCGNPDGKEFSYPKFLIYLLSEEFIREYRKVYDVDTDMFKGTVPMNYTFKEWKKALTWTACAVGGAIYEFQAGDIEPLTQLLKKI